MSRSASGEYRYPRRCPGNRNGTLPDRVRTVIRRTPSGTRTNPAATVLGKCREQVLAARPARKFWLPIRGVDRGSIVSALVRKRGPRRGFRCLRLAALANVLLVNLPAISVPVVHAETTWTGDVEVSTVGSTNDSDYRSSVTLAIPEGESRSYYLRLTEQPTDKDGNLIDGAVSNEENRWFVAIHVDGHRRSGGTYKNVSWIPTIGREIHENNWDQPNSVSITANEDPDTNDEVFTFTHHVWDHDGDCPVHLPGTVTVRVLDNDNVANLPTLRIDDVTVGEGAGEAEFEVTLSARREHDVTVSYSTSNGSARAGQDYTMKSGTLTIPQGTTSGTIRVPVIDDGAPESDETFYVNLSSPDGARIEDGRGTGTIEDNEPALSIGDVTVNEGRGPAVFTVTIDEASDRPVTVSYSTSNGTARAGQDYESTSGTLTITSPDTTGTIEVTVLDDGVPEPDETFQVRLSSADGARIEGARATGTIEDNEPALSIGDVTVNEGRGPAVFTVTIGEASDRPVTVNYATSNGTARAGQDYESTSGTLTITSPDTTGTIEVTVLDDGVPEPDETFQVRLSSADGARIEGARATGTIEDNEPALSIGDVTVNEGDGSAEFVVTMSETSERVVTVAYATSNGTARAGQDYTRTSDTLTIARGATSGTISVPVLDDGVPEPDETFYLNLSSPDGARIEDGRATGTIEDNEPALSVHDKTVNEGAGVAEFEVTMSESSDRDVTVSYATSNGTARAGRDYTSTSGRLTIAQGDASGTISVPVEDDGVLLEPDETFYVNLSSADGARIEDGRATGTIEDNDLSGRGVKFAAASYRVTEGSEVTVTVELTESPGPGNSITIPLTHSPAGGAGAADYSGNSGQRHVRGVRDAEVLQGHGQERRGGRRRRAGRTRIRRRVAVRLGAGRSRVFHRHNRRRPAFDRRRRLFDRRRRRAGGDGPRVQGVGAKVRQYGGVPCHGRARCADTVHSQPKGRSGWLGTVATSPDMRSAARRAFVARHCRSSAARLDDAHRRVGTVGSGRLVGRLVDAGRVGARRASRRRDRVRTQKSDGGRKPGRQRIPILADGRGQRAEGQRVGSGRVLPFRWRV